MILFNLPMSVLYFVLQDEKKHKIFRKNLIFSFDNFHIISIFVARASTNLSDRGIMVVLQPSKLAKRVRFPPVAPFFCIAWWCNGSTSGSGPLSQGSNPCRATRSFRSSILILYYYYLRIYSGSSPKTGARVNFSTA